METLIILGMVGIPAIAALIWFITPKGKEWLRANHMI